MSIYVGLLHGFAGLSELFYEILYIGKKKRLMIISMVRVMYAMISGILPCIMYLSNAEIMDTVTFSVNSMIMVLFSDIVGYFAIHLGYRLHCGRRYSLQPSGKVKTIHVSTRTVMVCCVVSLVIGWASLYLWTRSYGSFASFMRNAALIRSGYGQENSMAFFKHFAKLLNVTTPILCVYIVNALFTQKHIKISVWILTAVSVVGCVLFMLCSDSRGNMGTVVFVIFCAVCELWAERKHISIWKMIGIMGAAVLAVLMIISSASILMDRIRFSGLIEANVSPTKSLIDIIVNEFGFSLRGRLVAMNGIIHGEYRNFLFSDIINAAFSWFPSRFVPVELPQRLWVYNTILIKGTNHGTQPTDLITASVYYFYVLGPAILPVFWGSIVKWMEKICDRIDNDVFRICVKYRMAMTLLGWASHFQLYSIVYENMNLFLFVFMLWLVPKVRISRQVRLR